MKISGRYHFRPLLPQRRNERIFPDAVRERASAIRAGERQRRNLRETLIQKVLKFGKVG